MKHNDTCPCVTCRRDHFAFFILFFLFYFIFSEMATITIKNKDDETIVGILETKSNENKKLVLLVHGEQGMQLRVIEIHV